MSAILYDLKPDSSESYQKLHFIALCRGDIAFTIVVVTVFLTYFRVFESSIFFLILRVYWLIKNDRLVKLR